MPCGRASGKAWNLKGDLSYEDAVSLASKAVRKQFGFSQEEMWNFIPYARFARLALERPEWHLHFLKGEDPKRAPYARLDAKTGQVLEIGRWPEEVEQIISFLE